MKKYLLVILSIALCLAMVVGCGDTSTTGTTSEPASTDAPAQTPSTEPSAEPTETPAGKMETVTLLIPSTESEYWNNYVAVGVENACLDLKDKGLDIKYTLAGPATEAETDAYINALESVIAEKPDVLVMATIQPQAVVPYVEKAKQQGIVVNLVSLPIDGDPNNYGSLYYCDMVEQGQKAGENMIRLIKEKNLPTDGTIGVHMSVTIEVMENKIEKFKEVVNAEYPDIKILDTIYNENDINKGIANVENQVTSYGDELIGFFGNNNVSSNAISKVVQDQKLYEKMAVVASDSDEMTINAVRDGYVDAVVVQTPYAQGYEAVMGAYTRIIEGQEPEKDVNIPSVVLTKENVDSSEYKSLIDASSLKR